VRAGQRGCRTVDGSTERNEACRSGYWLPAAARSAAPPAVSPRPSDRLQGSTWSAQCWSRSARSVRERRPPRAAREIAGLVAFSISIDELAYPAEPDGWELPVATMESGSGGTSASEPAFDLLRLALVNFLVLFLNTPGGRCHHDSKSSGSSCSAPCPAQTVMRTCGSGEIPRRPGLGNAGRMTRQTGR